MRGRGSKRGLGGHAGIPQCRPPCGGVDRNMLNMCVEMEAGVAPHAGAWIETPPAQRLNPPPMSPPMRGRGSKQRKPKLPPSAASRPPCGGVDRNYSQRIAARNIKVAPHAGAWIETTPSCHDWLALMSPPMRGRGSKLRPCASLPCGAGRPPCGGVDRNPLPRGLPAGVKVAPHAGAWIETLARRSNLR